MMRMPTELAIWQVDGWYGMNQADMAELAGRASSDVSVGRLVFSGVLFPVGLVIACNIAQMVDRVFLFLVDVVPGPVVRA
ncbi:hypothetical protein JL475_30910 [Streptomyces sp. M2CJ-2]|uniref:hypothetical protein n=1 Tax=Streptomyces sp. M2CJ-2 TaxID=2803948 RepID=UPI0019282F09|nr:hypothetical protein [Streptomyces sp. M2CJ-2]MBL3670309.1 hypothetical protein [Streptomyces sp. M2CJ-2]